jgi:hypothetical protein
MAGVRDFEENFEKYGPLMFGLHDGQSEAPKIMAKRVSFTKQKNKVSFTKCSTRQTALT